CRAAAPPRRRRSSPTPWQSPSAGSAVGEGGAGQTESANVAASSYDAASTIDCRTMIMRRQAYPDLSCLPFGRSALCLAVAVLLLALVHRAVGGVERLGGILVAVKGMRAVGRRQRDLLALPEQ